MRKPGFSPLAVRLDQVAVSRRALLLILERYAGGDTSRDPESDEAFETLLEAIRVAPLILARSLAVEAHHGQVDKIGEPYIGHPGRVAISTREAGFDEDVQAVAWLHDVVEDTWVTLDDLRSFGFSERIVSAVDALTKRKGEKFSAYYERVKANPVAVAVKWHDVRDNADPRRLSKVAPDTQQRLREKYEKALMELVPVYPPPPQSGPEVTP